MYDNYNTFCINSSAVSHHVVMVGGHETICVLHPLKSSALDCAADLFREYEKICSEEPVSISNERPSILAIAITE